MKFIRARILASLFSALAFGPCVASAQMLDRMPPELETRYALSALPPKLRDGAAVYLLDPRKGYSLERKGTSGIGCLVQRTDFALADFRDDIYFAVCFDAAGAGYLKTVMDAAELRAQGITAVALKTEIEARWKSKTYVAPARAGLSYMIAPVMRTIGPPDAKVHTMAMPHYMYYAPNVTNEDIGAQPNLASAESLLYPFVDNQGTPEYSFFIQMVGQTEKAEIATRERTLVEALCQYRKVLCLPTASHSSH